jgi:hypothetical protein
LNIWFLDEIYDAAVVAQEPIDNEDDPNLLVERESSASHHTNHGGFNSLTKKLRNPIKKFSRSKREVVEIRFGDYKNESHHVEKHLKRKNAEIFPRDVLEQTKKVPEAAR